MKKNICIFTGSRADYGLMFNLLKKIKRSRQFKLDIIATCMHLSSRYGNTYREIEKDGFKINKKIKLPLSSDLSKNISKATGVAMKKFSIELSKINPDAVLILGDRFEAFAAAFASISEKIPVVHLHGGESTRALIDDAIRHSITKMSALHLVSHKFYKNRIVQMGENPKNVHVVGSLGVENIFLRKFFTKKEVEKKIKMKFAKTNLMATFHPETLAVSSIHKKLNPLLGILKNLKDTNIVFTFPNADSGNKSIYHLLKKFTKSDPKRFKCIKSLGQKLYFSYLKNCDLVVGNSSSGIIEVPSFRIPTINFGLRQGGRIKSRSVIDCDYKIISFKKALKKALSKKFRKKIKKFINPYHKNKTSDLIFKILKKTNFNKDLVQKKFYDIR
jgi:GDP/UDP-N,N'-diacetylbacillosamine 2-epimerase (hydrolysing)